MTARVIQVQPGPSVRDSRDEGANLVSVQAFGVLFRLSLYIVADNSSCCFLGYSIYKGTCWVHGSRSALSHRLCCSINRANHLRTSCDPFAGIGSIIAEAGSPHLGRPSAKTMVAKSFLPPFARRMSVSNPIEYLWLRLRSPWRVAWPYKQLVCFAWEAFVLEWKIVRLFKMTLNF